MVVANAAPVSLQGDDEEESDDEDWLNSVFRVPTPAEIEDWKNIKERDAKLAEEFERDKKENREQLALCLLSARVTKRFGAGLS